MSSDSPPEKRPRGGGTPPHPADCRRPVFNPPRLPKPVSREEILSALDRRTLDGKPAKLVKVSRGGVKTWVTIEGSSRWPLAHLIVSWHSSVGTYHTADPMDLMDSWGLDSRYATDDTSAFDERGGAVFGPGFDYFIRHPFLNRMVFRVLERTRAGHYLLVGGLHGTWKDSELFHHQETTKRHALNLLLEAGVDPEELPDDLRNLFEGRETNSLFHKSQAAMFLSGRG